MDFISLPDITTIVPILWQPVDSIPLKVTFRKLCIIIDRKTKSTYLIPVPNIVNAEWLINYFDTNIRPTIGYLLDMVTDRDPILSQINTKPR